MSSIVRVAGLQMGACTYNKQENLERACRLFQEAAKLNPHIVCTNELFQTYFFPVRYCEDSSPFFETIPGPTSKLLAGIAKQYGFYIIAGIAEVTEGKEQYNSAVIISPAGEIAGRYRKAHLPLNASDPPHRRTFEKNYFRQGNLGFPVFDLPVAKVGIIICYYRHFPEAFRVMSLKGAEIVFAPTAARTLEKAWRSRMWESVMRVRAYENGVYVVGVNKAGCEDGTQYIGRSLIVSPLGGNIITVSEKDGDDVIFAELDLDLLWKARDELPVNRERTNGARYLARPGCRHPALAQHRCLLCHRRQPAGTGPAHTQVKPGRRGAVWASPNLTTAIKAAWVQATAPFLFSSSIKSAI